MSVSKYEQIGAKQLSVIAYTERKALADFNVRDDPIIACITDYYRGKGSSFNECLGGLKTVWDKMTLDEQHTACDAAYGIYAHLENPHRKVNDITVETFSRVGFLLYGDWDKWNGTWRYSFERI